MSGSGLMVRDGRSAAGAVSQRPPAGRGRRASERGSATVLGIGAILLVLSVLVGFLVLGAAVQGSLRARAAADAAALAGAGILLEGGAEGTACAAAEDLATTNGGTLLSCGRHGDSTATTTAQLRVEVEVTIPGLRGLTARAVAHAGAVPQGDPRDG